MSRGFQENTRSSHGSQTQVRNVPHPAKSENIPVPRETLILDTLHPEAPSFPLCQTKSLAHDSVSLQPRFSWSWEGGDTHNRETDRFHHLKYIQMHVHIPPQNVLGTSYVANTVLATGETEVNKPEMELPHTERSV